MTVKQANVQIYVCMCAQLSPTLCDSMDCSPPGSSVHEVFQARILERVAISFSRESPPPRDWSLISWVFCIGRQIFLPVHHRLLLLLLSHFSRVRLCATPETAAQPGFPVPGILQARTLEWVAIAFSNAWKWKGKVKSLSRVRLLATPWTAAHQTPPSMGFSRQEYWSGLPLPWCS